MRRGNREKEERGSWCGDGGTSEAEREKGIEGDEITGRRTKGR